MQAPRYARLYEIAALAFLVVLVYWPSTVFLYQKWTDTAETTYTHGWLILLICVALVVGSRRELGAAPVHPSRLAAVTLALTIVAWLVAYRASVEGLEVPLQPMIFWLAVTAAFGWRLGRLMLFPVAYFYFAVNLWYGSPLQHLTVRVMRGLLAVTGPPAVIEGDVIHLSNGTFLIEEGCSGLHFMIVGLAVAALYGEQRRDVWRVRVRQVALMAGLALLANWVRVYTVIEAGYLTNMQSYLVRVSHYGFGWGVFAVTLLVFFWLAPYLGPEPALPPAAAAPPAANGVGRAEFGGFMTALAILLALPLLNVALRISRPAPPLAHPTASLNPQPPWGAVPVDIRSPWLPVFPRADELQRRAFGRSADDAVEVLGVAYRIQRQGAELVGETSSLTGEGLQARAERVVGSAAGPFGEVEVTDRVGEHSLIWVRYQVSGRNLVGPIAQQVWYGINALVWRPPAGLVALRTPCRPDCGSARRTLQEFVAHSGMR
jgi:exosortase